MRQVARFFGFLFATGALVFVVLACVAAATVWTFEKDLPDYTQLKNYEPAVMTRVQAGDGSLVAEYARERRLYLPSAAIPPLVKEAFISAEDKNFYTHNGVDPEGVLRALGVLVQGTRRAQGASTITQQVAKNFFLTNERSFTRKIREALLALRIEQTYSKERILELYLNEIYLGLGNYGIAAAALNYFDKSVNELSIAEVAYLAGLPKGPNNYQPFLHRDAAVDRRNYVLSRMAENGYITKAEAEKAKAEPLGINPRVLTPNTFAAGYFAEEVRRELSDRYGEKKLYEGGLSVRTTLDPKMQVMARKALVDGLVRYDEAHGFRGAIRHIDLATGDWGPPLAAIPAFGDVQPWRLAVVLDGSDAAVRIGLQPGRDKAGEVVMDRDTGTLNLDGIKWTGKRSIRSILTPGDIVYVAPVDGRPGQWRLQQVPEISGAIVAMDPYTGRVFAMVGGFSFDQSEFNRATQAQRQPGSSFKPFVYAAALDNGYTPSSSVLDAPIELPGGPGQEPWRPQNDDDAPPGPHTLRYGIEHSRNLMTIRLAKDIGMPLVVEYAKRFGIYDELPAYLPMALGAGETTVLRMVTAYSMLANGGKRIKPTLIDRIQDRWGNTIYRHDERTCEGCDAASWTDQAEPKLIDKREQVIDPMTAYQITWILKGVIDRGTGSAIKVLNRNLAGKTGTTNDAKDVWFVGYSSDLAVGLYLGYDQPRSLGEKAFAAEYAAPVFRDFMGMALKDKPDVPFRAPLNIKLIQVDYRSGMRSNGAGAIIEAFKPGTAPPDSYSVIDGVAGAGGGSRAARGDSGAGTAPAASEKSVDSGFY